MNTNKSFWELDAIGKPFQIPTEAYHLNTEHVQYSDCDCSGLFQYLKIPPVLYISTSKRMRKNALAGRNIQHTCVSV